LGFNLKEQLMKKFAQFGHRLAHSGVLALVLAASSACGDGEGGGSEAADSSGSENVDGSDDSAGTESPDVQVDADADSNGQDAASDAEEEGDGGDAEGTVECPLAPCSDPPQCVGGQLAQCGTDANGCVVEIFTDCAEGSSCVQQPNGAACVENSQDCGELECLEQGARRCSRDSIQTCEPSGDCLVWTTTEECEGACEDDGSGPSCASERRCSDDDACDMEGPTCDGDTLVVCVVGTDGCLEVESQEDCASAGLQCGDGPPAACVGGGDEVVGGWAFQLVADFDSDNPSGLGPLTQLDNNPSLSDGAVYFRGAASKPIVPPQATQADAVYCWSSSGGLEAILQTGVQIPEGTGSFLSFDALVINAPVASAGRVAIVGNGAALQRGIYLRDGSQWKKIADRNTTVPGSTKVFDGIGEPLLDGDDLVLFGSDGAGQGGVYWWNGEALRRAVTYDDSPPNGSSTFSGVGATDVKDGQVALLAYADPPVGATFTGGQISLYRVTLEDTIDGQTTFEVVVDRSFQIPTIGDNFFNSTGGLIDGAETVFMGQGNPGPLGPFGTQIYKGLFRKVGSDFEKIADTNDQMPESVETFSYDFANGVSSQYVAVSGGATAFRGVGTTGNQYTQIGVYVSPAGLGPPEKVLDLGDTLQGKEIKDILMGRHGFDGSRVALMVEFADKEQAIYLAKKL
jgi:hypothetical protein